MKTVSIQTNQSNLLANLRYAFADKTTFMAELAQNSRRAGATEIRFSYQDDVLTVEDDGQGISDMQKLLTVAESGWDDEILINEQPYGMGFLSALFAAKSIVIESCGQRLEAEVDRLIDPRQTHPVQSVEEKAGTMIKLKGVSLAWYEVQQALVALAIGYPTPLFFNGAALGRGNAIDQRKFEECAVGHVSAPWFEESYTDEQIVNMLLYSTVRSYLLGIDVTGMTSGWDTTFVVHLDPQQFAGKCPDRNSLVDEKDQLHRIQACIENLVRQWLEQRMGEIGEAAFVEKYWTVCLRAYPALLNRCMVLPSFLLQQIRHPTCNQAGGATPCFSIAKQKTRQELIEEGARLFEGGAEGWLDEDGTIFAKWEYLRGIGCYLFSSDLPDGHWAYEFVQPAVDEMAVSITINGVVAEQIADVWGPVNMLACESIVLNGPYGEVVNRSHAFAALLEREGLDNITPTILVPAQSSGREAAVQLSPFCDDNDYWQEDWQSGAEAMAVRTVEGMRHKDPVALMNSLVNDLNLQMYPLLSEQQLVLSMKNGGGHHVLSLDGLLNSLATKLGLDIHQVRATALAITS